jgi:hypothetical protein
VSPAREDAHRGRGCRRGGGGADLESNKTQTYNSERYRRGQFDVPHPLAANAAVGDLDAAAVADHPLVLHAAVLAASALPVLLRTENPLAEEAVLLRPVGPVVDRLRLLDLAEGPAPNVVGPGKADLDGSEIVDAFV